MAGSYEEQKKLIDNVIENSQDIIKRINEDMPDIIADLLAGKPVSYGGSLIEFDGETISTYLI